MINTTKGRNVLDFRSPEADENNKGEFRRILLPYLILILSQLPLSLIYLKVLWTERSHYALLPIALVATIVFALLKWPRKNKHQFFPSVKSDFLLFCGLLFGVSGTLLLSPWFGFASLVFLLGSLLARTNDRHVFGTLLPAIVPLFVLLQPPMSMDFDSNHGDIQLISSINSSATNIAGAILDLSKYPHNISASRMEFPFGTIDSASLANNSLSVFTLLIVTAMFISWQRMAMVRGGLLLLAACFWGMTFEALSMVVCAIGETSFEKDYYSPGGSNRALQIASLFCAGIMTLLTDRLIAFLCGPVDIQAIDENISYQDMLCRFWNNYMAGVPSETVDVNMKKEVAAAKRRCSNPSPATSSLLWGASILLGVLCVFQISGLGVAFAKSGKTAFSESELAISENAMPVTVGEWIRSNYKVSEPVHRNPHDTVDHFWTFTNESEMTCIVEVSQPYSGWHDSAMEILRNDWRPVVDPETKELKIDDLAMPYQTGYYRDTLANYRLAFSFQMDGFGRAFEAPLTWKSLSSFFGRAMARLGNRTHPRVISNLSLEINLYNDGIGPTSDEDRQRAEELFLQIVSHVRSSMLDGTLSGSAEADSQ